MRPLSLVMPCYNEAKSLPALVSRALECARRRDLAPSEFRLYLVENGSRDESLAVMRELKSRAGGEFLEIVPVSPNRGYGNGVFQGLLAAASRGGVLAWTHADEQCDPEDVFKAWEILGREEDSRVLVKGRRYGRSFQERVISRGFEWIASLIFLRRFHEINAQPKVFPAELMERVTDPPLDFAFDLYVLIRAREAGFRVREIDVLFPPRKHGQSNWSATFRSKFRTIARMIRYMVRYRLGLEGRPAAGGKRGNGSSSSGGGSGNDLGRRVA